MFNSLPQQQQGQPPSRQKAVNNAANYSSLISINTKAVFTSHPSQHQIQSATLQQSLSNRNIPQKQVQPQFVGAGNNRPGQPKNKKKKKKKNVKNTQYRIINNPQKFLQTPEPVPSTSQFGNNQNRTNQQHKKIPPLINNLPVPVVQDPRANTSINTHGFQDPRVASSSMANNMNQEPIMTPNFNFNDCPRYVHMDVGDTIYLDTFSKLIYEPNNTNLNDKVLKRADMWHQFVVHHNGEFNKQEILSALFRLVRKNEMFPIGYRTFAKFDYFLLTAADRNAIEILFKKNLKLIVKNRELCISVRLCAGQIVMGQVHPQTQIILVCKELLEKSFLYGNNQIVDLEGLEKHSALTEVAVTMNNPHHLITIIKALQEHDVAAQSLKGIRMPNCEIDQLDPLRFLSTFENLVSLDLRNNKIASFMELKHLEKLNIVHLYIAGNPFTETEERTYIQERVKRMIPTLKYLDDFELLSVKIKEEPGMSSNQDLFFDIVFEGDPIRPNDDLNLVTFKQKYKTSNYWHKVIVHHDGKYNRKQIVSKLLNLVDNHDLWPCYYQSFEKYDEFFVHNNFEALEILVRNQLIIKTVQTDDIITIKLQMNVSPFKVGQVDVVEKIQKVCLEQFISKTLYLNSLAERDIFANVIIDMSSPRVVSQILLWASRKCGSQCVALNLNNNGLVSCNGMYPLVYFPKLKDLNLRNNRIESFERLSGIPQGNKISSIILEGNPLCNTNLHQYVKSAKHFFPDLETLDGITLPEHLYMLSRQNFLCSPEAYMFVEAFVKHFFSIYESNQRHLLKELYTDSALFTISSNFDMQRSKEIMRTSKYTSKSRNIARLMNFDQASKNVFIGPEEIMKTLLETHVVEFDYLSFNIDVPLYTSHSALIVVNGILKDKPLQFLDEEFLLDFTRVFFIKAINTCMGVSGLSAQYKIQNDMLCVRNVTINQKPTAFQPRIPEAPNDELTDAEKDSLLVVFQEMTKLNRHWSNRFLNESKWNFKFALNICIKLLEDDEIPNDAFETRFGV